MLGQYQLVKHQSALYRLGYVLPYLTKLQNPTTIIDVKSPERRREKVCVLSIDQESQYTLEIRSASLIRQAQPVGIFWSISLVTKTHDRTIRRKRLVYVLRFQLAVTICERKEFIHSRCASSCCPGGEQFYILVNGISAGVVCELSSFISLFRPILSFACFSSTVRLIMKQCDQVFFREIVFGFPLIFAQQLHRPFVYSRHVAAYFL